MEKKLIAQNIMAAMTENEEFCKAFVSAENAADMHKVLTSNGFEVSIEDVNEMFAAGLNEISKFKESGAAGELGEEQLDEVAGGGFWKGAGRTVISFGAAFGMGCLCGLNPALTPVAYKVAFGLAVWSAAGYVQ